MVQFINFKYPLQPSITCIPIPERLEALGVRRPQDFLNGTEEFGEKQVEEEDEVKEEEEEVDKPAICTLGETVYEDQLFNVARAQSNSAGWCWITGVVGEGSSCSDAMVNALNTLQGENYYRSTRKKGKH